jgi:putative pyruvate formate lyase activating enzyme
MRQYTPMEVHKDFLELARKLTTLEYQKVLSYAQKIGFETIYTQEKESASASFIPDFN